MSSELRKVYYELGAPERVPSNFALYYLVASSQQIVRQVLENIIRSNFD